VSAPPRYALILDTETTSLEPPPKGAAIEVAVTLFDLTHAQPVESFASLIRCDRNEAVRVNGIPIEMLKSASPSAIVWGHVKAIAERAQVVVAHNAEFDRQFTPDLGIPWVCSEGDIQWPHQARGGSLVNLALSLGLGVASAHRAMADVDTLARIFTRLVERGHDLSELVRHAMRPKALFYALVSFEEKELAKECGFRWDGSEKVWFKRMAVDDVKALPFKTRRVKEDR
jgi:DNA polymerase-3 subunit epsilon